MKDIVEETKKLILQEMSVRVGNVIGGKYLVYVNTDDSGNIPHFHIVDTNSRGEEFHTCVKIDNPEYFHHGNKTDTFNTRQLKELNNFLASPFEKSKFHGTNWEYIVMIWNMNNSSTVIEDDASQPDYTKLK